MGKSLIIKGADFSANAILTPEEKFMGELSQCFIPDKSMAHQSANEVTIGTTDSTRAIVWDADLSDYYNEGFRSIKLSFKTGKSYIVATGPSNTNVSMMSGGGSWSWVNVANITFTINSGDRLYIHLKNTDGSTIPSTAIVGDFIDSVKFTQ